MKKLIVLFTVVFSLFVNAGTLTQEDKKEMLRQFVVFQKAIENKDIKTLTAMVQLPMEEAPVLLSDELGNPPAGYDYGEKAVTAKEMEKYKDRVFKNLEAVLYVKVNPETGKITNYFKDNATEEDKMKKYYYDSERESYYYKEKNTKKYLENSRIWDDRVELDFYDNGMYVLEYSTPNKLTPKEPAGDGGAVYEFSFEKNKLKLHLLYWND